MALGLPVEKPEVAITMPLFIKAAASWALITLERNSGHKILSVSIYSSNNNGQKIQAYLQSRPCKKAY
jgi:hypothetical protein